LSVTLTLSLEINLWGKQTVQQILQHAVTDTWANKSPDKEVNCIIAWCWMLVYCSQQDLSGLCYTTEVPCATRTSESIDVAKSFGKS
jgi:hypothetical protein